MMNETPKRQQALRHALLHEFSEIRARNSSYSLRAFAKKIGIQAPALSQILNGKRFVSVRLARDILIRLNVSTGEIENILNAMMESDDIESLNASRYQMIDMNTYHLVGDWFHFAILSLIETKGFVLEPEWIASRLGIDQKESKSALERLEALGFIKRAGGRIHLSKPKFGTLDNVPNAAVRGSHAQSLELAKESLFKDAVDLRDMTTLNLAVDVSKLSQAKELIRNFREKVAQLLESGDQTEVYQLCVQLFPVSKTLQ